SGVSLHVTSTNIFSPVSNTRQPIYTLFPYTTLFRSGVNAIEVAAALVDGLKRIWISPTESASIKLTKLQAGGESSNIIPGNATFSIDARAQKNETMETLTAAFEKVVRAVSTM